MKGLLLVVALACAVPAQGQSLIQMYRSARFMEQAEQVLRKRGLRVQPLPPAHVPAPSDLRWRSVFGIRPVIVPFEQTIQPRAPFVATRWRPIRRLERGWFERAYSDARWDYLGSNYQTALDTTWTRELRARLEARFGPPTQTLAELDRQALAGQDLMQFEYWFVVNDSIPFRVMDVDGPLDRGLVIATDRKYRDLLQSIRKAFMQELYETDRLAPYVDYYYDWAEQLWYKTGFDGEEYFLQEIRGPEAIRGRPLPEDI